MITIDDLADDRCAAALQLLREFRSDGPLGTGLRGAWIPLGDPTLAAARDLRTCGFWDGLTCDNGCYFWLRDAEVPR
jgi:hypothetical protein